MLLIYRISIEEVDSETVGTGTVGLADEELIGQSHFLLRLNHSVVSDCCELNRQSLVIELSSMVSFSLHFADEN